MLAYEESRHKSATVAEKKKGAHTLTLDARSETDRVANATLAALHTKFKTKQGQPLKDLFQQAEKAGARDHRLTEAGLAAFLDLAGVVGASKKQVKIILAAAKPSRSGEISFAELSRSVTSAEHERPVFSSPEKGANKDWSNEQVRETYMLQTRVSSNEQASGEDRFSSMQRRAASARYAERESFDKHFDNTRTARASSADFAPELEGKGLRI